MHQPYIQQAVFDVLAILTADDTHEDDAITALEIALDQFAFASHFITYTFEPDWPDPPSHMYTLWRERAQQRFPSFGLYNLPEEITTQIGTTTIVVSHALDDLSDIASELDSVLWCWDHTSPNDALWHLKQGCEGHLGRHIRNLQYYLSAFKNKL